MPPPSSDKKRILLLLPTLFNPNDRGGIQVFNRYLVRALIDLGYEIQVIALNDRSIDGPPQPAPWWTPCNDRTRRRRLRMARESWRAVHDVKPDLVINGHVNLSSMCLWLKRFTAMRYMTITHGIDVWSLSPARRKGLLGSDRILAVSGFTRRKLVEQLPEYPAERIVVFPNTFDPERFQPAPRSQRIASALGLPPSARVIFTVCRLAESERPKGYDKVVRAMPEVLERVPDAVYVLGGRGKDAERVQSLIDELDLAGKVVLAGFIPDEDLVAYYNLCDVFVMPSVKEGFGIVYLEAMACGKRCIAGNRDGSVDALLNGELGLLIDPDNPDEIADSIVRMLTGNTDELWKDADWLRRRVIEEYGFDAFKARLRSLIDSAT